MVNKPFPNQWDQHKYPIKIHEVVKQALHYRKQAVLFSNLMVVHWKPKTYFQMGIQSWSMSTRVLYSAKELQVYPAINKYETHLLILRINCYRNIGTFLFKKKLNYQQIHIFFTLLKEIGEKGCFWLDIIFF